MMYQTLKYIFIRVGLSFFLLITFGFFTLYFIHEIALPSAVFNDAFIQWLILLVCLFFGFLGYGLIGEQRFHNAMYKLKDVPSTADSSEVIAGFEAVINFTYSSSFLPSYGERLRNSVIMKFADYLLFIGQDENFAQKIYLKAFLLAPEGSPYRVPLLSVLEKGKDLAEEEIDLLLVMLNAEDFHDNAISNYLASLFLFKGVLTRKTEPIFLSALEVESQDAKEIMNFVLPKLLEKKRSDSFALNFYHSALRLDPPEALKIREEVARVYCQGSWKGIDSFLHKKSKEVFEELDFERRSDIMKEVSVSRFSGKIKNINLFSKADLVKLKSLKSRLGLSKSFVEYLRDALKSLIKISINLGQAFILSLFRLKTWAIISLFIVMLIGILNYRKTVQPENSSLREKDNNLNTIKGLSSQRELKVYTLQVAAFTSSNQASDLIKELRKKGVRGVYQVRNKRNSGETWYKIRVGRFNSNESARRFANQLMSQKTIKNYFIISLPVN